MSKHKLVILIVVIVLLPFILIGILSSIKNRSNNPQSTQQPTPTITPAPQTSNIAEFKTISGRLVEINPEYIVININGALQNFEFDRDIDASGFKEDQIVTLVFSKQGDKVMDILVK